MSGDGVMNISVFIANAKNSSKATMMDKRIVKSTTEEGTESLLPVRNE
jgi:hypothetical protein